jgi:hypothetical protein
MASEGQAGSTWRWIPGAAIAVFTGCYQLLLASDPSNDHFMNVVWAREIAAGRLPSRDYFEAGEPLSEAVSAAAETLFGYRLLSEAVIVGLAFGVSAWLVYKLVRELTGGTFPAVVAATLVAVAGTRGYSYPKLLIYAVGAELFWRYVRDQSRGRLAAMAAWIGIAFLWRHDHGIYIAAGSIVTLVVVHDLSKAMLVRSCQVTAMALLVTTPYLGWVQMQRGVLAYVADARSVMGAEFADHSPLALPSWPIRGLDDLVGLDSKVRYAPDINVKWAADATTAERESVAARFQLASDDVSQGLTTRVRLLDPTSDNIRALVNDPKIADTHGIDRRSSSIPTTSWDLVDRVRFRFAPLRIRLPLLEERKRAADTATWMFLSLIAAAMAWCYRHRSADGSPVRDQRRGVTIVAALSIMSMPGLLRQPLSVYAPDFIVLPAILAGWAVWMVLKAAAARGLMRIAWPAAASMSALLVLAVGSTGLFWSRISQLPVDSSSLVAVGEVWSDAWRRLSASPPSAYWTGRRTPDRIALAKYVQNCTAPGTPLLILDFAPDIQYYADRPLASRHLLFGPGRWDSLEDQQGSIEKLRNASPPVVIARAPFYRNDFQRHYPLMARYISDEYQIAPAPQGASQTYLILTNRAMDPMGLEPGSGRPCFAPFPKDHAIEATL